MRPLCTKLEMSVIKSAPKVNYNKADEKGIIYTDFQNSIEFNRK